MDLHLQGVGLMSAQQERRTAGRRAHSKAEILIGVQ